MLKFIEKNHQVYQHFCSRLYIGINLLYFKEYFHLLCIRSIQKRGSETDGSRWIILIHR